MHGFLTSKERVESERKNRIEPEKNNSFEGKIPKFDQDDRSKSLASLEIR